MSRIAALVIVALAGIFISVAGAISENWTVFAVGQIVFLACFLSLVHMRTHIP